MQHHCARLVSHLSDMGQFAEEDVVEACGMTGMQLRPATIEPYSDHATRILESRLGADCFTRRPRHLTTSACDPPVPMARTPDSAPIGTDD